MEKDWKKRLDALHDKEVGDGMYGNCAAANEGLSCCVEKEWLLDFIEAELDRAREETRQEERDMFIVRYATVSFNEVIKTIKTLSIIEFLSIKWGLKGKKKSKLTTK